MSKRIDYSKLFQKRLAKAPLEIQRAFQKRQELFRQNHFHPLLNNHKLTGEYRGCRSFNITSDWRVVYAETSDKILFITLGTHSQLYQ